MTTEKIGIIGGTFNPIHTGHLILAQFFAEEIRLDRCFFVPAHISPFKTEDEDARRILPEHRARMTSLAVEDHPFFAVDSFELENSGVSFTIDTVNYFKMKFSKAKLYLLIGDDQLKDFQKWKDWQNIIKDTELFVLKRTLEISDAERNELTEGLSVEGKKPTLLNNPVIEISSTDIRRRISNGLSIKYLVPESVENYIIKYGLYK